MNVALHLCMLLCTINANAAAVSQLTKLGTLQEVPYEEPPPSSGTTRPEEARFEGADEPQIIDCQPAIRKLTGRDAISRDPSSTAEARLKGSQTFRRQRKTLADDPSFRLPTMDEATKIREACTAPLQNASRDPWSGTLEMFSAELWAEHTLQLVETPELRAFLESNNKYFYDKNTHVDLRFGASPVNLIYARERLQLLLAAFMRFCDANDLHPWLAHGSLLGLSWSQMIAPYDDDIDMQLPISELRALQAWDQTLLEDTFLVDINPHFPYRRVRDKDMNIIDARIVDTRSGVFIDLTALSTVSPAPGLSRVGCKSPHFYEVDWLFPLRRGRMEGVEVWIPADVSQVLGSEYTMGGYKAGPFKGYYFNVLSRTWQVVKKPVKG